MNTNDPTTESDPVEPSEDFRHSGDQRSHASGSAPGGSPQSADEEVPVSDAAKERETSKEAFDDLVSAAKDAFRSGSDDARDAARNAIPKAREGFNKGLHDLAYGLAYGLSFGSTLARELTPEVMRHGFTEGSDAGRDAAENFMEKQRQANAGRKQRASTAPHDDPEEFSTPSHGEVHDDDDTSGAPVYV